MLREIPVLLNLTRSKSVKKEDRVKMLDIARIVADACEYINENQVANSTTVTAAATAAPPTRATLTLDLTLTARNRERLWLGR